jgi:hypothetical protein
MTCTIIEAMTAGNARTQVQTCEVAKPLPTASRSQGPACRTAQHRRRAVRSDDRKGRLAGPRSTAEGRCGVTINRCAPIAVIFDGSRSISIVAEPRQPRTS